MHQWSCALHGILIQSIYTFMMASSITARLAQSAERQALNLMVVGSSPTVGVSVSVITWKMLYSQVSGVAACKCYAQQRCQL